MPTTMAGLTDDSIGSTDLDKLFLEAGKRASEVSEKSTTVVMRI